jgi:hypothetical protein
LSPDQPLNITLCPVCGKELQSLRCNSIKGCGRAFELRLLAAMVEITGSRCPQSIRPHDKIAQCGTRTVMGADGTVRRKRVWA